MSIAVWPRRLCNVRARMKRGKPSEVDIVEKTTVYDMWLQRENGMRLEWASLYRRAYSSCGLGPSSWASCFFSAGAKAASQTAGVLEGSLPLRRQRVIQAAPSLPLLALADALRQRGVARASAIPAACAALLKHDRLFCLSLFFGVPMVDRTATLTGALRLARTARQPPTRADVEAERRRLFSGVQGWRAEDAVVHCSHGAAGAAPGPSSAPCPMQADLDLHGRVGAVCQQALDDALIARAEALWAESERADPAMDVKVMWSGGIDSTTALVSLLRTSDPIYVRTLRAPSEEQMTEMSRRRRLVVVYDDESVMENTAFFEKFVRREGRTQEEACEQQFKLRAEHRNNRGVSLVAGTHKHLTVTGELGDQLFGSDRCKAAFPETQAPEAAALLDPEQIKLLMLPQRQVREASKPFQAAHVSPELKSLQTRCAQLRETERAEQHFHKSEAGAGLAKRWQASLLPALSEMKLLPGGDSDAWEQWIAPQLAKAPFAITSAFDMLWWLNFSCKWQQVGMRCCHDGGSPLAPVFEGRGNYMVLMEEDGGGGAAGGGARGGVGAREDKTAASLLGGIRHFFDDPQLELWASVPECHVRKVCVCVGVLM